jgi:glycosyltransferase involved in cell wall biosynthesis
MTPMPVEPLVSVLVPVYNHAAYVSECLDSILNEDYGRLELIIIDDGSRDASWAIIQEWVQRHRNRFVRVVAETQSNQGICKTFNRLVSVADGEYLTITASDDALVRGGIRARVAHLQAHAGHLAVFGCVTIIGDNDKAVKWLADRQQHSRLAWRQPRLFARELLLRWNLAGPVLMCRRTAFDPQIGVGLYDERFCFEDLDFFLRLLSRDALGFVDRVVAAYRIHATSTCRSDETHLRSAPADTLRIYAKNVKSFTGINRLIVMLKMWIAAQGLQRMSRPRYLLARQLLSLIKRFHALQARFPARSKGR